MTRSFYDLLGVPSDADTDEIRRAYRRRIKETHPDLNDDPDASEETAKLVEAKDVLTDEGERARYDRLGHDTYVSEASNPWAGSSGRTDPGERSTGTTDADAGADAADSGNASGSTNARTSAEGRRRRERRAREDVDFGSSTRGSATTSPGESGSDRATNRAGSGPNASTSGGGGRSATATNEPPSWSDTSEGWAARSPAESSAGFVAHVLEAVTRAPATAMVTFLLYPLLVLGTFFPPFPLVVNVVVGACLLAMVAAAQSVPGLGVAVYGTWSILAPIGLLWTGNNPLSPVGLVVLTTTWLPLGFSVLTYMVLDS